MKQVAVQQGPPWTEITSMLASGAAGYRERARAVYWNEDTSACRALGDQHAECLLLPGHPGPHYGNGYDTWGPLGSRQWPRKDDV